MNPSRFCRVIEALAHVARIASTTSPVAMSGGTHTGSGHHVIPARPF